MKKILKKSAAALAALTLTAALAGCGSSASSAATSTDTTASTAETSDENELEKMSEQLSELPLRYAERILVSCFNHLQLSERDKIPAFETMPELLNWIHSWLQNQY